jgi:secondary thiamine-phosphate synthase enzyme
MFQKHFEIKTRQQLEILDITDLVKSAVAESRLTSGLVNIFVPHTTAGVKLNHYEPMLLQDLLRTLSRLAPQDVSYNHDLFEQRQNISPGERSNGHAHVKNFFLESSQTIPLFSGSLQLGDKQSIFFVECDGGRKRHFSVNILSHEA